MRLPSFLNYPSSINAACCVKACAFTDSEDQRGEEIGPLNGWKRGWRKTRWPPSWRKWIQIWLVVSNIFYFHPYLGRWSNSTNIVEMGWNHQLEEMKWNKNTHTQNPAKLLIPRWGYGRTCAVCCGGLQVKCCEVWMNGFDESNFEKRQYKMDIIWHGLIHERQRFKTNNFGDMTWWVWNNLLPEKTLWWLYGICELIIDDWWTMLLASWWNPKSSQPSAVFFLRCTETSKKHKKQIGKIYTFSWSSPFLQMGGAKHPDFSQANPYPRKSAGARAANPWKWELSVRQSGFGEVMFKGFKIDDEDDI